MAASREHYQLSATDVIALRTELNFILARIADRFDRIEGIRGTSTIENTLQIGSENVVHGFNTENET